MVKPIGYPTDSIHNYQQALSDFGITELLSMGSLRLPQNLKNALASD